MDNVDCYTGRVTPERRYSIQTGAMRLFVAAWPAESALGALADVRPITETPDLRWVPPVNWHVTLAFLGSVPDDEHDELVEALRSIGRSAPRCAAILGPETSVLGTRVLCVPVGGLGELALMVRECTAPFNRPVGSSGRDRRAGRLGMARDRDQAGVVDDETRRCRVLPDGVGGARWLTPGIHIRTCVRGYSAREPLVRVR